MLYDKNKLLLLKTAFTAAPPADPAMMQGGAPPMDPSMMQGGGMPMDPSMMAPAGGMPMGDPMMAAPPDPSMMGGAPAPPPGGDPAADPMMQQEMMRQMIRDEMQAIMGQQGAGADGMAKPKGQGSKVDQAISSMNQRVDELTKAMVVGFRQGGIEIPLADMLSLGQAGTDPSSTGGQTPPSEQAAPAAAEIMQPGLEGNDEGSQPAKVGSLSDDLQVLHKLAEVRDALNRTGLGAKTASAQRDPLNASRDYLAGLYR
jgi:hypothetical protein